MKNSAKSASSDKPLLFILLILFASTLTPMMSDVYLPSLPAIVWDLHTTEQWVKLTITIYFAGVMLGAPIYGPLSDHFGRRPTLLVSLALTVLASIGCAATSDITFLILARALQGFGVAGVQLLIRAMIRDKYQGSQLAKVASLISLVFTLSPLLAPVLGGYLETWFGWRSVFLFLLGYSAVTFLLFSILLPETNHFTRQKPLTLHSVTAGYLALLRIPSFLVYTACTSLCFSALLAYVTASPFLFQGHFDLTALQFGHLTMLTTSAFFLGRLVNNWCIRHYPIDHLLFCFVVIATFGGLLGIVMPLLGMNSLIETLIPIILFLFGFAVVTPLCTPLALEEIPHLAGTGSAALGTLQMLGGFLGSGVVAWLHIRSMLGIACYMTFVLCLTICILGCYLQHIPPRQLEVPQ